MDALFSNLVDNNIGSQASPLLSTAVHGTQTRSHKKAKMRCLLGQEELGGHVRGRLSLQQVVELVVCAWYRELEHFNIRPSDKHRDLSDVAVKEQVLDTADAPGTIRLDG
jgi:hypothetical protein